MVIGKNGQKLSFSEFSQKRISGFFLFSCQVFFGPRKLFVKNNFCPKVIWDKRCTEAHYGIILFFMFYIFVKYDWI